MRRRLAALAVGRGPFVAPCRAVPLAERLGGRVLAVGGSGVLLNLAGQNLGDANRIGDGIGGRLLALGGLWALSGTSLHGAKRIIWGHDGFSKNIPSILHVGIAFRNVSQHYALCRLWYVLYGGWRMYRVKVRTVGDGQHPSEAVVSVNTADGKQEELIVDRRSLEGGALRIGYPVMSKEGQFLIELPRETMRGSWRVWVRENELERAA